MDESDEIEIQNGETGILLDSGDPKVYRLKTVVPSPTPESKAPSQRGNYNTSLIYVPGCLLTILNVFRPS